MEELIGWASGVLELQRTCTSGRMVPVADEPEDVVVLRAFSDLKVGVTTGALKATAAKRMTEEKMVDFMMK